MEKEMNIEEIRSNFKNCEWMRAHLNDITVDAIVWLMDEVERLEQEIKARGEWDA